MIKLFKTHIMVHIYMQIKYHVRILLIDIVLFAESNITVFSLNFHFQELLLKYELYYNTT